MAELPIRKLKNKDGNFYPLTTPKAVVDKNGKNYEEIINEKFNSAGIKRIYKDTIVLNSLETGIYILDTDATLVTYSGAHSLSVDKNTLILCFRNYYQTEPEPDKLETHYVTAGEIFYVKQGSFSSRYSFCDAENDDRFDRIQQTFNYNNGLTTGRGAKFESLTIDGDSQLNGNVTVTGYVNATSDIRLKENIDDVNEEIIKSMVENTPIKAFNYKENGNRTIGLMAQDIENIDINGAEFIDKDEEGYLKVRESKLVYVLWNYCQQLNSRIKELEEKVK